MTYKKVKYKWHISVWNIGTGVPEPIARIQLWLAGFTLPSGAATLFNDNPNYALALGGISFVVNVFLHMVELEEVK